MSLFKTSINKSLAQTTIDQEAAPVATGTATESLNDGGTQIISPEAPAGEAAPQAGLEDLQSAEASGAVTEEAEAPAQEDGADQVTRHNPDSAGEQQAEAPAQEEQTQSEEQQAEQAEAPAAEAKAPSAEAAAAADQLSAGVPDAPTPLVVRSAAAKMVQVVNYLEQGRTFDRRLQALNNTMRDQLMIDGFAQVATKHSLSAPLVEAFRAAPGFDQAVAGFPESSLYNIVPAPKTSQRQVMGLESFDAAQQATVSEIQTKIKDVAGSFSALVAGLGVTVDNLRAQLAEDSAALASSDITEEVLETLPVNTMASESFTEVMGKLNDQLQMVGRFDVDEERANPETISASVEGLTEIVGNIGGVIGLELKGTGLSEGDRDSKFEASEGNFASKNITVAGLEYYMAQANEILTSLKTIADAKDTIVASVVEASTDLPAAMNSDDVTYGCHEHVALFGCYTTLTAKLIRESISVVSQVLSTVDSVLDVDDGQSDGDHEFRG